jgi:hypothetical protein
MNLLLSRKNLLAFIIITLFTGCDSEYYAYYDFSVVNPTNQPVLVQYCFTDTVEAILHGKEDSSITIYHEQRQYDKQGSDPPAPLTQELFEFRINHLNFFILNGDKREKIDSPGALQINNWELEKGRDNFMGTHEFYFYYYFHIEVPGHFKK